MKGIIETLYQKFRNLILYGLIGGLSSSVDFIVYTALVKYVMENYLIANSLSVTVGILISFTLNRKYNFKVTDKTAKRFLMFFAVGFSGMIVSNVLLYLFIDELQINEILSKLLSIVVVVVCQFVVNKYVTFKTK